VKPLAPTVERMVSLDDPFEPEWAGMAEAAEPYRRACWQGMRDDADLPARAWARTRLAVNLLLQGQHRHAQAELVAAGATLAAPATGPAAGLASQHALEQCAGTLAAAPLSVNVEPVLQRARAALASCRNALAAGEAPDYLVGWALAAADTWLELDAEPTPASLQALWAAVEPLWQHAQARHEPAALPWLIRLAHHLAGVGPVDTATWGSLAQALERSLGGLPAGPASGTATARTTPTAPAAAPRPTASPLPFTVVAQRTDQHPKRWHPLAAARGACRTDAQPETGRGDPWRLDLQASSQALASIAELPWHAMPDARDSVIRLARSLPAWRPIDTQDPPVGAAADALAERPANLPPAIRARLHLAAARLLADAGAVAEAVRMGYGACGLRLAEGSIDLANARALLQRLAAAGLARDPSRGGARGQALHSIGPQHPQRVALSAWLQLALPARTDAFRQAVQQAELATWAGDRAEALLWRRQAVDAACAHEGPDSAAHLQALQGLREALADADPDHPDLEDVHDEGADLARRLHGSQSAASWWWRALRAMWWHERGHGRALQALAQEARAVIDQTVAGGDREACACLRELIDAAAQAQPSTPDEEGLQPRLHRVQ
jgi:hypothetical protein